MAIYDEGKDEFLRPLSITLGKEREGIFIVGSQEKNSNLNWDSDLRISSPALYQSYPGSHAQVVERWARNLEV